MRTRHSATARLVALLLLTGATGIAQADDYIYFVNDGAVTISGYTGPGGNVTIPGEIIGLPVTSIGPSAFWMCTSLTSVTIPEAATLIGNGAFGYCSSLTNVTLPDGLEEVESAAFYACSALASVTVPKGVTRIGERVFEHCVNLVAIEVAAPNAFYSSLDGVLFDKGQGALLAFPGGKPFPYTFPSTVRIIGNCAFAGNMQLANIMIPDSVTSIGYDAFYDCENLTSITIGAGVTAIGSRAFSCYRLSSISVDPVNTAYSSLDGVLFDKGQRTLVAYPKAKGQGYTIPDSVVSIGDYAFYYCQNLTNVAISSGVTTIGNGAFYSCTELNNIALPSNLTSIGNEAFYHCSKLSNITLPDTLTSIGVSAFGDCDSLSDVRLPSGLTYLSAAMFYHCGNLREVAVPSGITYIDSGVFAGCDKLTGVFFEGDAPGVFYNAFEGASNAVVYYLPGTAGWGTTFADRPTAMLELPYTFTSGNGTITITGYTGPGGNVTIPREIIGLPVASIGDSAFPWNSSLASVIIPNGVVSIGNNVFVGCTSLTNVTIPASVTSIGSESFNWCMSLAAITVDSSNAVFSSVDGVVFNKDHSTLIQCPGGKTGEYSVPDGVTSIAKAAFLGCGGLTTIMLPDSVTNIEYHSFYGCSGLTDMTLSNGLKQIGDAALQYCVSLASINIPEGLTRIGCGAFENCTSLTAVAIPQSAIDICSRAFGFCTSLKMIAVEPLNPAYTSVDGVLFNKDQTRLIQYPGGKTGSYAVPESVASIGNAAFLGCTNLTAVSLPDGVANIEQHAFAECRSLTSIAIPRRVASIWQEAFADCPSLEAVQCWGDAPSAGAYLFQRTTNVVVYYLPGTMGWGATFANRPTAPWVLPRPVILATFPNFGLQAGKFAFTISWATNASVVVEACTDLGGRVWSPVATNALTAGTNYFSDPDWAKHAGRVFRVKKADGQ